MAKKTRVKSAPMAEHASENGAVHENGVATSNGAASKKAASKKVASKRAASNRIVGEPTEAAKALHDTIMISAPNFQYADINIVGDSPYVQNRFGAKAIEMIMGIQIAGSVAKKGKKREPKDFEECFREAQHRSHQGWCGIPSAAFRQAMIRACSLQDFHMTKAKMAIFVLSDGYDVVDRSGLTRIYGEPVNLTVPVRLKSGVCDIRARPMFEPGWTAKVRIMFDADLFSGTDIYNLMARVGMQVGVGEGRHSSKDSNGCGWGTFQLVRREQ